MQKESDTPCRAGGLMSGAASKAVNPSTQHRVRLKFFPSLTRQQNASHIHNLCHIHSWAKRIAQFLISMQMGMALAPLNIVFL